MNLRVLKVIQEGETNEFCKYCPEYSTLVESIKSIYNTFIDNMKKIYEEVLPLCKSRKDYAIYIQKYNRSYHKYLFALYDKADIDIYAISLKTKRLYNDLFIKTKKPDRKINDYGYTPENNYGKYSSHIKEWENIQTENSKKIVTSDKIDIKSVKYVAGLDISFDKNDDTIGVSYITVYDILGKKIVYEDHKKCVLTIPYISGLLGFREVPEYIALLQKLKKYKPEYYPDILMVDAFGILHHRGFGSASHLGFETDIPTIGVAKTLLYIDGLDERKIKTHFREKCKVVGDFIELVGESGKIYGVAYKSTNDALNPIYITVGHNISLNSCIKIVESTTIYRIPEPIRNSDIKSKIFLR